MLLIMLRKQRMKTLLMWLLPESGSMRFLWVARGRSSITFMLLLQLLSSLMAAGENRSHNTLLYQLVLYTSLTFSLVSSAAKLLTNLFITWNYSCIFDFHIWFKCHTLIDYGVSWMNYFIDPVRLAAMDTCPQGCGVHIHNEQHLRAHIKRCRQD